MTMLFFLSKFDQHPISPYQLRFMGSVKVKCVGLEIRALSKRRITCSVLLLRALSFGVFKSDAEVFRIIFKDPEHRARDDATGHVSF